jgi:flagellar motor switch protein FliM
MDDTEDKNPPTIPASDNAEDVEGLFKSPSDNEDMPNNEFSANDIDGLFEEPLPQKKLKGIAAILNSAKVYSERLPILDVVFDRLVRLLTTTLRNFTSDNVDISCSRIHSVRFSDYLNEIPLPALLGVFKAKQWDTPALITVDSQLIYSIVDVLLGGRKVSHANRPEGRAYTTLERNLVKRLIEVILVDFTEAFSPVCKVDFQYERLETNPRFATIVHEKNVTMKITFKLEMEDRGGNFDIILPYSSVEPIRDLLLQNFMGEKFGRDHIWEDHLADRIREANVSLEAALPTEEFPLKEVLSWKKGTHVALSSNMQTPVHLHSQNHQLLLGRMGQKNGHIAIKVNDILFGKNGEVP